jgi:hypothetical protein
MKALRRFFLLHVGRAINHVFDTDLELCSRCGWLGPHSLGGQYGDDFLCSVCCVAIERRR